MPKINLFLKIPRYSDLPRIEKNFQESLEDDFNTPKAIMVFKDLSSVVNKYLETRKNKQVLTQLHTLYRQFSDVLGIFASPVKEEIPGDVARLVEERETARKRKDWGTSDKLREEIKALGYIVRDTKEGPNVKRANV